MPVAAHAPLRKDASSGSGRPAIRPSRRRGVLDALTKTGLVVTGLVGMLVIGWYVFSLLTGARLAVLMTGSMSPDLPAGSAAVTLPVQAAELALGDVVTLQRDDASLPVTHRIVQIEDGPTAEARSLILQGDDNPVPDLFPYVVDEAHRMVVGVPQLGTVLGAVRAPWAILMLTAVVAALVLAAFWPDHSKED